MKLTIAIQPDDYTARDKPSESDASSPRWARFLEAAGHEVRWVDVYRPDILEQIEGCNAFMWRWAHFGGMFQIARRLLPVIERELRIPVYPDQNTCWHYDDKIAQAYLFTALKIPTPKTWCWFTEAGAKQWANQANYPVVLKLSSGAGSRNVRLVSSVAEANQWIERLFRVGTDRLDSSFQEPPWGMRKRLRAAGKALLNGEAQRQQARVTWPLEKNYIMFQEFLSGNEYDTRVTVIGNKAFARRRFNRPDDFRASGSGEFDVNDKEIDEGFVRLAFETARKLRAQNCSIDGLYRGDSRTVAEVSYTCVSWVVHECPGHWELDEDPWTGTLRWIEGHLWPEEAQILDFLKRLETRTAAKAAD